MAGRLLELMKKLSPKRWRVYEDDADDGGADEVREVEDTPVKAQKRRQMQQGQLACNDDDAARAGKRMRRARVLQTHSVNVPVVAAASKRKAKGKQQRGAAAAAAARIASGKGHDQQTTKKGMDTPDVKGNHKKNSTTGKGATGRGAAKNSKGGGVFAAKSLLAATPVAVRPDLSLISPSPTLTRQRRKRGSADDYSGDEGPRPGGVDGVASALGGGGGGGAYVLTPGNYDRPLENGKVVSHTEMREIEAGIIALASQAAAAAGSAGGGGRRRQRNVGGVSGVHTAAGGKTVAYEAHTDNELLDMGQMLLNYAEALTGVTVVPRNSSAYQRVVKEAPTVADVFEWCGATPLPDDDDGDKAGSSGKKKSSSKSSSSSNSKGKAHKGYKGYASSPRMSNQAVMGVNQAQRVILDGELLSDEDVLVLVNTSTGRACGFVYVIDQSCSCPNSTGIMNFRLDVRQKAAARAAQQGVSAPPPIDMAIQQQSLEIVAICASRTEAPAGTGRLLLLSAMLRYATRGLRGVILDVVHAQPRQHVPSEPARMYNNQGMWEKGSLYSGKIASYYAEYFRFQRCFPLGMLHVEPKGRFSDVFVEGMEPYSSVHIGGGADDSEREKCIMYRCFPAPADLVRFAGRLVHDVQKRK